MKIITKETLVIGKAGKLTTIPPNAQLDDKDLGLPADEVAALLARGVIVDSSPAEADEVA